MSYQYLSEHQLLTLAAKEKTHNKEINIEWRKRYRINFPYKLDLSGNIKNCVINALVGDRECDFKILEQANILRDKLKQKRVEKGINC